MKILSLILTVLMMSFVLVGTTSAAIQLDLTNNSPAPYTLEGYADNSIFDSITKHYSGTDIVPISLTNTGNTIIYDGVLQFNGPVTDLQNVVDDVASLVVGDGIHSSNLIANSISVDTLTIAAGSTITIRRSRWTSSGIHARTNELADMATDRINGSHGLPPP